MPDSLPDAPLNPHVKPIAPEPVPFTEYGDAHHKAGRKSWRKWLLSVALVIVVAAIGLTAAVLWLGEVKVAGMTLRNPFVEHEVAAPQIKTVQQAASSPTPTAQSGLLKPLNLDSISPRLVIEEDANQQYLIDYDGSNKTKSDLFKLSSMMGGSNTCAYFVKDGYDIYRSAIDGSQEQLVATLDEKMFDLKSVDIGGHVGPGYGVSILGVDAECQQAVVSIYMNAATDDMPQDGSYLLSPEKKQGLIRLDSDKVFIEFRDGKPWFAAHGHIYEVNLNGVFSEPFKWTVPAGFKASESSNLSSNGVLIDSVHLNHTDNSYDPVENKYVTERISKIVEVNLNTGKAKALVADSPNFYQHDLVSPGFNYVFYAHDTMEKVFDSQLQELYVFSRDSDTTHKLNVAKGSLGSRAIWLDDQTFTITHTAVPAVARQYVHSILKCSATAYSCQEIASGRLLTESHY